jgi:adenine-specific DNA methylase
VLYISGLPVEKNLVTGLRRKLSTITEAFTIIHGRKAHVDVHQRSSCCIDLPGQSIDHIFVDPPFGGNIPYAEINFVNEAWLNHFTDRRDEIIISKDQEKSLADYQALLTDALSEMRRILKVKGKITLVFHSASADVWNALQAAYEGAGFGVECAGVLDKTQGSFKQVTTEGAVRGDPVLLLSKRPTKTEHSVQCIWKVAEHLRREAVLIPDPIEQTARRL